MSLVCGIDVGSLRTLGYVAWVRDREVTFDIYVPSREQPLPIPPSGWPAPAIVALDAPQGLAQLGRARRVADVTARTPTSKLPRDRRELAAWKLYRGLIEAGIEMFWAVADQGLGSIAGIEGQTRAPLACETYPRYVIRRLWPDLRIPSKKNAPLDYVEALWTKLEEDGYRCAGVVRPTVDQVDAVLCARAAESCLDGDLPSGTVGVAPWIDSEARVIREGLIVSP